MPLLVGAFFLVQGIFTRFAQFHETLIADDRGVTWRAPLRRARFIAWGDIEYFVVRWGVASYCIFERQETISFKGPQTPGVEAFDPPAEETITPPSRRPDRTKTANEAYDAQARQLIATIVARGARPLLAAGANFTIEDVAAAPFADDRTLGLTMAQPDTVLAAGETLVLQTALPRRMIFRSSLRWALFIPIALLAFLAIVSPTTLLPPLILAPSNLEYLVGGCALLWLMGVALIPLMQTQLYRNAHPAIEANARGITLRGYNNKSLGNVAWTDVRAWATEAFSANHEYGAQAHRPDTLDLGRQFIIATNNKGDSLAWDEPADAELNGARLATPEARRAAYRERAATLHALIAARTGLPLRELPPA